MEAVKVFSMEEINHQVKRILEFPTFMNSQVLIKFLEFIIDETIHQRELCIKEYSVAINVLHRSPGFNPQTDAVVRIHAGRLRRALNDYYLTKGLYDPIIIHIPKGTYVPKFYEGGKSEFNDAISPVLPRSVAKPVVAVFPFRYIPCTPDMDEFPLILGEQLSAELSEFQEISVIGYYSMEMTAKIKENILEAGKLVSADYIINGAIQYNGLHIRIRINLLNTKTGEVLLSKNFEKDILSKDLISIEDEILQNVAAPLLARIMGLVQGIAKAPQ